MATDQLDISRSSGQQTATQSPQAAGQAGNSGAQSSSVQPGTATALLNSESGVPLRGSTLPTVSLNTPATTSTVARSAPQPPAKHQANPALLALPAILVLVALILFWTTSRTAKNTT